MWHMGDWGWFMVMGWLGMILFWGIIIWAVVTVVSRNSSGGTDKAPPAQPPSSALSILEKRYARGEITREEFEEMRRTLHR